MRARGRARLAAQRLLREWLPVLARGSGSRELFPPFARRFCEAKPSTDLGETDGAEARSAEHRRLGA